MPQQHEELAGLTVLHVALTPTAHRDGVRAALPALSDVGPATPRVACAGRLCPRKGHGVLLRAWPAVSAVLPGARLVLVGDGPGRRRLTR